MVEAQEEQTIAQLVAPVLRRLLLDLNAAHKTVDAVRRGLRVLLVEQNDLASATSSASSKLIHGGLRYLEHYEFGLVRSALNEREIECLTWSARGKTSPEIAQIVNISKRTVNFHIEKACRKLNVATRTEAVVKASSGRLIDP